MNGELSLSSGGAAQSRKLLTPIVITSVQLLLMLRSRLTEPSTQIWGLHIRAGMVTLFVGETSAGKTVFLHNLAYHLAVGKEFLGITPVRPMRVLYVDYETPPEVLAEHLTSIGVVEGWDFYPVGPVEGGRDNDGHDSCGSPVIDKLATVVHEGRYDVVVIDPLVEAVPVKDENDNSQANAQMLMFRRLAQKTGAAVVVVHNSGVKKKANKFLGRGASSRVDRADVVINYMTKGPTERLLQVVKSRSSNLNDEIHLRFAGDLGYDLIESTSSDPTKEVLLQVRTVEIVREETAQGRPHVRRKKFMDQLNIRERSGESQALDRALQSNIAVGALIRPHKGEYALPAVGKPVSVADEMEVYLGH